MRSVQSFTKGESQSLKNKEGELNCTDVCLQDSACSDILFTHDWKQQRETKFIVESKHFQTHKVATLSDLQLLHPILCWDFCTEDETTGHAPKATKVPKMPTNDN